MAGVHDIAVGGAWTPWQDVHGTEAGVTRNTGRTVTWLPCQGALLIGKVHKILAEDETLAQSGMDLWKGVHGSLKKH